MMRSSDSALSGSFDAAHAFRIAFLILSMQKGSSEPSRFVMMKFFGAHIRCPVDEVKDEEAANLIKLGCFFVCCGDIVRWLACSFFCAANIGGKNNKTKEKMSRKKVGSFQGAKNQRVCQNGQLFDDLQNVMC